MKPLTRGNRLILLLVLLLAAVLFGMLFSTLSYSERIAQAQSGNTTIPPSQIAFQSSNRYGCAEQDSEIRYTVLLTNSNDTPINAEINNSISQPLQLWGPQTAPDGEEDLSDGQYTWKGSIDGGTNIEVSYAVSIPQTVTIGSALIDKTIVTIPGAIKEYTRNLYITCTLSYLSAFYHKAPLTPTATPTPTPTPTPTRMPLPTVANPGFESGAVVWDQLANGIEQTLIFAKEDLPPFGPFEGDWAAWLGGFSNETTTLSQTIFLPAGYPNAELRYYYYIESGEFASACDESGNDSASVQINGNPKKTYELCAATAQPQWRLDRIALEAFGGQEMTIEFRAVIDGDGRLSTFFVDSVLLCAPGVDGHECQ